MHSENRLSYRSGNGTGRKFTTNTCRASPLAICRQQEDPRVSLPAPLAAVLNLPQQVTVQINPCPAYYVDL